MYKKAYHILKNNSMFIQPLLVWQIAFTMVMVFCMNRNQMLLPRITLWISIALLFTACLAGWLYINKYALLSYNEKDTPEEISEKAVQNFKKFFEGVGTDFVRTLLACIVISALYFGVIYGLYKFCLNNFGIPSFINDIMQISQSGTKEQIMQFINNLGENDKLTFARWVMTINLGLSVLNFFALLYFAVMSLERKNFIVSFFTSLKFFIINIFEAIGIMIFVFFLYLLINILSVFLGVNSFLFAVLVIIVTWYFNYYVLLVFCFYYDKTKINSDNGSEFIGEDKSCGETGEKT